MKIARSLTFVLVAAALVTTACKKKETPKSPEETQKELIAVTWKVGSVTPSTLPEIAKYSAITLTFSVDANGNLNYSQNNPDNAKNAPAKASSGTWDYEFANSTITSVTFDPGTANEKTIEDVTVSATALSFSFRGQGAKPIAADSLDVTYNMTRQ